ncbi:MAG: lipoyl(octanoyl) transferase, partial [Elusimicrobia bacterium]
RPFPRLFRRPPKRRWAAPFTFRLRCPPADMLVRVLGLRDYEEIWELQRRLAADRAADRVPDTLLLVEHHPVFTRGRSSRQPIPSSLPYPLHTVERGGDITYHGPGQLVGYPILHLGRLGLGVRDYLRALETVLIEALAAWDLEAERLRGFTGVWHKGRKLASIGVAVKNRVSFHGFALNVNCDLEPFARIHPCRLEPEQISSMSGALGRQVEADQVVGGLAQAFLGAFAGPAREKSHSPMFRAP